MDVGNPAVTVAAATAAARTATGEAARDVAGALDRRAGELRELRLRLVALGEVPWRSTAALLFRERLDEHVREAAALAVRCDAAAALVRAHAVAVDGALAGAGAAVQGAAAGVAAGAAGTALRVLR
ncbi:hypothetical protein CLV92_102280 [Kineococcus xinjiangensis]|uniref:Uncharacterized protein n=1 Tax=Kineococcus xinjiangensis TaxID=512762 RepID=A0A2S6IV29_9ACTN|nr:hypothetical protein [Kineococcus xinjiangensis]PPK98127.1 hypothetical protein CLV92_102280 [Kineococcus xinjiangensis]